MKRVRGAVKGLILTCSAALGLVVTSSGMLASTVLPAGAVLPATIPSAYAAPATVAVAAPVSVPGSATDPAGDTVAEDARHVAGEAVGVVAGEEGPYDAFRVVHRALEHHLGVRVAQLQYAAALARTVESRAALRPALSVDARPYWLETRVPDFDALVKLIEIDWPDQLDQDAIEDVIDDISDSFESIREMLAEGLPERTQGGRGYTVSMSGRLSLWKSPLQRALESIAAVDEQQAEADLETAVAIAIVQSLEAYFGVLRAEAALRAAELGLEDVQLRAAEIASRKAAGTATRVDELQVEAELYQAEARVIQARGEVTAARMGLNQTLGFSPHTMLDVVEVDIPAAWPELDDAIRLAEQRGDVQRAQGDLDKSRAAAVIAREQAGVGVQLFGQYRWPDVELSIGVDRQGYLGGTVTHNRMYLGDSQQDGETESWTAGIELSWSIFDGHQRRAKVAQAELQAEQAALHAQQIYDMAATEVTAAYARLQAAQQALDGARRGVAAATEAVAVARELAAAGAATERDVLRAQMALAGAEQGRLEATYGFTLAQAAYLQSSGVLLAHWLELVGLDHIPIEFP